MSIFTYYVIYFMGVYLWSKFLEVGLYIKVILYFNFLMETAKFRKLFFFLNVAKPAFLLVERNYEETK